MFQIHPSKALNELFINKPYQGADPDQTKFLFIGLDANYSPTIENNSIFPKILEYHENGVAFWQKYGVHHPFLLSEYKGDGKYFHKSFANIGFKPEHANQVCFIELLDVPTVGRSKIDFSDINQNHLARINWLIQFGYAEHIFVTPTVIQLLKKCTHFSWLMNHPIEKLGALDVIAKFETKSVYRHLHFSNYGKFLSTKIEQAKSIGLLI